MQNVLIAVYLLVVLALIGVILLQRSEGGGLGMGSSSGGLISVRGSANLLTRTTAILATLFFVTAIALSILSELDNGGTSGIADLADSLGNGATTNGTAPTNLLDALNSMGGGGSDALPVPQTTPAPAATTTTSTTPSDPGLAVPAAPATTPTTTAPAN